jgi:hypothetical protein
MAGRIKLPRGPKLLLNKNAWLLIGTVVAGLATIVLTIVALRDFQSPTSGDLVAATAIGTPMSLAILLVGLLVILGLESAHLGRHRLTHMSLFRAPGRGPRVAMRIPADHAVRPHHSDRDRPGRRP